MTKSVPSIALKVAAAYAVFGIAWILGSDQLVAALFTDPAALTLVQSWKGLTYVALSAGLIYAAASYLLKALAASEQRYRSLFAESPEALVLYDPLDYVLIDCNDAACRLLGADRQALTGRKITDFMIPACRQAFLDQSPRRTQLAQTTELWRLHCADRDIDVSAYDQGVAGGHRQILLIDVTARLRAETELLRALDELAATNERMQDLGHAVSHDLQEPLRQISGFVQLLERRYRDVIDDEARQYIDYAVEGTARLKSLIGDLTRFTARSAQTACPVDSRAVVGDVVDGLRETLTRAEVDLRIDDLPVVQADPYRLAVVFHSLLDNAIKFRRPEVPCVIAVAADDDGDYWIFRVTDNGIGIAPEYQADVFSLFRRLHTRHSIPGNGLGLALAKKMVESLGGRIWTEPAPGGGAVLAFTLPAIAAPADG